MKRFLLISLAAIATLASVTISSCKVDKCKAIVCSNGGNCEEDGACTCPIGYEGERCETVSRDRFRGAWIVDEDGTVSSIAHYAASIENGPEINQVVLRNFNNQNNASIVATIVKDSIFIPTQTYPFSGITKTVVGYGKIEAEPVYGQHGVLKLYFKVTSSDGVVDFFGYQDNGQASTWVK